MSDHPDMGLVLLSLLALAMVDKMESMVVEPLMGLLMDVKMDQMMGKVMA